MFRWMHDTSVVFRFLIVKTHAILSLSIQWMKCTYFDGGEGEMAMTQLLEWFWDAFFWTSQKNEQAFTVQIHKEMFVDRVNLACTCKMKWYVHQDHPGPRKTGVTSMPYLCVLCAAGCQEPATIAGGLYENWRDTTTIHWKWWNRNSSSKDKGSLNLGFQNSCVSHKFSQTGRLKKSHLLISIADWGWHFDPSRNIESLGIDGCSTSKIDWKPNPSWGSHPNMASITTTRHYCFPFRIVLPEECLSTKIDCYEICTRSI